ncbi:hypothetical protein O988_04186 [Pseudogymnoascus sp. VKM F-3808]|nr:hypothetical protein O988_04186 [Pseudogymnoascus sp. VKM F-3808]
MSVSASHVYEELYVNDGKLQPHQIAILRPSLCDEPIENLRGRFQKDGYLFLKGLLPRDEVLQARQEYFKLIAPSGVLAPGTTPIQGIFDTSKSISDFPGIGAGPTDESVKPSETGELFLELARQAHTEDWYAKTFCHLPALKGFIAKFTNWGEDTMQLRRSLLRNNIPGSKAIGPHYDQIFLRHGDTTNLTAWVPMGDISIKGGGLIYLEGSQSIGTEMEANFEKKAIAAGFTEKEIKSAYNKNMMAGGLLSTAPAAFAKEYNRRWMVTNYEAGDVVLHSCFMIHASTVNHDPQDIIRLATDLRFCDSSKPYDKRWASDLEEFNEDGF